MANCLPPSFESNSYRGGNIVIDLSGNNQNYSELISAYDSAKPAIYLGDGWCTFPDLDNFDSEKLLKAFTLKVTFYLSLVTILTYLLWKLFQTETHLKGKRFMWLELGPVTNVHGFLSANVSVNLSSETTWSLI